MSAILPIFKPAAQIATRSATHHIQNSSRYILPRLSRIFYKPQQNSSFNNPKVRVVSYKEMQEICEKNFEQRMNKIISDKL